MQTESVNKIFGVALGVCLVCSVLVSVAAVSLSGIQAENARVDKIKNILQAGDLYEKGGDVVAVYNSKIQPEIVNLATGEELPASEQNGLLSIEGFDISKVAADKELGVAIPAEKDLPDIKRKPKYMPVYVVKNGDKLEKVIFPIYGRGLWSTMYGFMALGSDLETIRGLTFYSHGETPGLGGEVDNPRWKEQWKGLEAYDDQGKVIITVIKGKVDRSKPDANHMVDGLSGATITTRGVNALVKFWLGDEGYGPFLQKLRKEVADGEQV
ncbi:MAG TPA: Na(+)-translocating NADH-quinone reductase subunit C [Calditrichia bacterium]|nr:Na(+)-translocating NADH-quinone reductase subunit C [Calditrichia bacterium]HQV33212.1 Na(+)-translocating NADH-quinone reductase subunit C [Calditrichia bacterium]